MFILSTLEDNVRIAPQDLGKPVEVAITAVLEKAFLDRVLSYLGLVITLYDILEVGDGYIYPSDGAAHYRVTFRVVVFRPFADELLVGRVSRMDARGIHVSMGFFEDVVIPPYGMPESTTWEEADKAWVWHMEGNDLFFEKGLPIRFKAQSVNFAAVPTLAEQAQQRADGEHACGSQARPYVSMEVVGKADGDGLGMSHWYGGMDEDGGE